MQDLILRLVEDTSNDEVDNGKGKSTDNQSDTGVENSCSGFFGFAGIARRSHVFDTSDDNEYHRYKATNENDGFEDTSDSRWKSRATSATAVSGFDFC